MWMIALFAGLLAAGAPQIEYAAAFDRALGLALDVSDLEPCPDGVLERLTPPEPEEVASGEAPRVFCFVAPHARAEALAAQIEQRLAARGYESVSGEGGSETYSRNGVSVQVSGMPLPPGEDGDRFVFLASIG